MVSGSGENQIRGNAILNQLAPHEGEIKVDALLLDLYGGQSSVPSEMLFFDLQGNLFSRDSVSDLAVVNDLAMLQDYYKKSREKEKKGANRQPKGTREDAGRDALFKDRNKKKKKGNR
jgi:hypothetical protein